MTRTVIEDLPVLDDLSTSEVKNTIGGNGRAATLDFSTEETPTDEPRAAKPAKKTVDGLMCWSDEIC